MKADEMAKMFDLDLPTIGGEESESSDYNVRETAVNTSFEQHIDDVKSILSPEPLPELNETTDNKVVSPVVMIQPGIFSCNQSPSANDAKENKTDIKGVVTESIVSSENPLDLIGDDLSAYQLIKKQYPQFILYDGSKAFKEFYQWKIKMLKNVLTRFPLLPVKSLRSDLREIRLDHQVGSERVIPEVIRKKMDDSYSCRTRLSEILLDAYEQSPAWRRVYEMLQSKLFKDHAQRGAHNRDALVLEHLSDVDGYISELEGFILAAKHIDHILQAAAESLSRQLSCIQLKEPTGTVYHEASDNGRSSGSGLDKFDSIRDGTVINKPQAMGHIVNQDFGINKPDSLIDLIG